MERFDRTSRRHLGKQVILGAVGATFPALAAAGASAARQTAEPWRAGDPLRVAGPPNGIASLDPALSRDLATNLILRQVWRGLVSLDAELKPRMELAESIDVSADGLRYDITIRDNARFQDSRSVTAEDVRGSFSRALDPAIAGGRVDGLAAITYLRDIEGADELLAGSGSSLRGIEITGERSLVITLQERSPAFLLKLASVPASIVDAGAAASGSEWLVNPNGSGPFAVSTWDPATAIELQSAETWWSGRPASGSLRFLLGVSASQPVNLYQAGEVDLVPNLQPELVDLVRDPASGVTYGSLLETTILAASYIAFGNTEPPLDDVHVRRALQRVFPARLIAESTYRGEAIAADGMLPPGMLGETWPVTRLPVDTEAAREELARSSYGSAGRVPPIQVYAADVTELVSLREVAEAELGLDVQVIQVAWPDFVAGLAQRRYPAYALYWGADYPDPEAIIDMLFGSGSTDNYTGYANPELDALLAEAKSGDNETRIAAYVAANQVLIDDAAVIPLCHWRGYTLAREGVGGVTATAMGILGLESIHAT